MVLNGIDNRKLSSIVVSSYLESVRQRFPGYMGLSERSTILTDWAIGLWATSTFTCTLLLTLYGVVQLGGGLRVSEEINKNKNR